MKSIFLFLSFVILFAACQNDKPVDIDNEKTLSAAEQLLNESIQFHDPDGNWANFNEGMNLRQVTPNRPERLSAVLINNKKHSFKYLRHYGDTLVISSIENDKCDFEVIAGDNSFKNDQISKADSAKFRLNKERIKMLQGYHIYLYGMPMKLKDEGTIIDPEVTSTAFNDIPCKSIRVTYEAEVGEDIWYFYFDNETSALIGYRFYHDEAINDGEFITFEDMATVGGIKMPKSRSWYYNKDTGFLGTDIIEDQILKKYFK
jgi:hypothetical protein